MLHAEHRLILFWYRQDGNLFHHISQNSFPSTVVVDDAGFSMREGRAVLNRRFWMGGGQDPGVGVFVESGCLTPVLVSSFPAFHYYA